MNQCLDGRLHPTELDVIYESVKKGWKEKAAFTSVYRDPLILVRLSGNCNVLRSENEVFYSKHPISVNLSVEVDGSTPRTLTISFISGWFPKSEDPDTGEVESELPNLNQHT